MIAVYLLFEQPSQVNFTDALDHPLLLIVNFVNLLINRVQVKFFINKTLY